MRMTGGQAVVETLRAGGVTEVFGIPGLHNLAIYDALFQYPGIRHISCRHEQGAGFAADGYARTSGRPGVVLTTTGPGATNAFTAVAEAWSESSPVLHLASQIDRHLIEHRSAPGAGRGAIPSDHLLSVGGRWTGEPRLQRFLSESDALFVVGSRLGAGDTSQCRIARRIDSLQPV